MFRMFDLSDLAVFINFLVFWICIKLLLKDRKVTKKELIGFLTLSLVNVLLFHYFKVLISPFIFFSCICLLTFIKKSSFKTNVIIAALSLIITALADHMTTLLLDLLFPHMRSASLTRPEFALTFFFPLQILLVLFLSLLIRKKLRNIMEQSSHFQAIFMGICLLIHGIALFGYYFRGLFWKYMAIGLFKPRFFMIYLLISFISVSFFMISLKLKYEKQRRKDEYEALQLYIAQIETQYTELRKFRHDYQNILTSLEDYIVNKDYDKLKAYYFTKIKSASETIVKNDFSLERLNRIQIREVKSILAAKLMLAQESDIDATFEAEETITEVPVDSIILIRIIGIILDNAIEELRTLKHGKLMVGMFQDHHTITFIAQNTCHPQTPKVHILKQPGFSTKGENRGLGLSTLSELVQSHPNLSNETMIVDNQFIQKIMIQGG